MLIEKMAVLDGSINGTFCRVKRDFAELYLDSEQGRPLDIAKICEIEAAINEIWRDYIEYVCVSDRLIEILESPEIVLEEYPEDLD